MNPRLPVLCGIVVITGCSVPQPAAVLSESPIACERGSAHSFGLVAPSDFTPERSAIRLNQDLPWNLLTPSVTQNVRLDVCADGAAVELKRVVWQEGGFSPRWEAQGPRILLVRGLDDALFGDHSGLEIRLSSGDSSELMIKGWKQGEHSFVTAIPVGFDANGSYQIHSMSFVTGVFDMYDPFADTRCKPGQNPSTAVFSLGTARFSAELCTYLGGGETLGYDVLKLSVTDSNPALAEANRKEVVLEGEALERVFQSKWNHHNACDSFVLKLPHASYASTAAPMAGCGVALPEAPQRNWEDQRPGLLYRVKYGSRAWSADQEVASCRHFMFGCGAE